MDQKTSSLKYKTGLGFDPYAHSKTHAPTVVKSLCNGRFEVTNEPKKMVFKSAGIMLSTNTMNANVASTSKAKHKVKYTCTHCGRDGHFVQFCFKLATKQMKEKFNASSNVRVACSFMTKNMSNAQSEFFNKNTRVASIFSHRVSQYWIPKYLLSNPGAETSTCAVFV